MTSPEESPGDAAKRMAISGSGPGPNASQGEIAGYNDKLYGAINNSENNMGAGGQRRGYVSPGSAEVSGGPAQREWDKQRSISEMNQNNGAQAGNFSAMSGTDANMRSDRGTVSPENATISGRAAAARGQEMGSLDLMRQAAEGGAPSAAAFQTKLAMDGNMGSMAGSAGSARGLGALTGAQGAAGLGGAASSAAMSGGLGRSKEIGDATGMYGTQAGNVVANDLQRLDVSNKNANANADLNDKWKVDNANLLNRQGGLQNDMANSDRAWDAQSRSYNLKQMAYDQEMRGVDRGQDISAGQAKRASQLAAADRDRQQQAQFAQIGLGAIGSLAGPLGTAAGGMLGSQVAGTNEKGKYY